MSAIYKEGYWYPADSLNTLKAITLSNADYEALTPQEKEELGGIEIFIPDRPLTEGGTGAVIIYNGVEYAGTPTSRLETLEEIVGDGQQSVGSDLTDAVTQLNFSLTHSLKAQQVQFGLQNTVTINGNSNGNVLNHFDLSTSTLVDSVFTNKTLADLFGGHTILGVVGLWCTGGKIPYETIVWEGTNEVTIGFYNQVASPVTVTAVRLLVFYI